jgi:cobalt/nickel transport system permease protein
MHLTLDRYAHLDSPIHRWDTRYKLVGLLILLASFAAVRHTLMLPVILFLTLAVAKLSCLPLRFFFTRLSYPSGMLLAIILVTMLATDGTTALTLGPLTITHEGVHSAVLIATRFGCILSVGVVLFGTAPMLTTIRAMTALGLPALLGDMLLFFWRYLHDLSATLTTMQRAMRLRGFQTTRLTPHTLRTLASLMGSLLVRSYAQSERVYQAMRLRGYGQPTHPAYRYGTIGQPTLADKLALALVLALAVGVIGVEVLLSTGRIG